MTASNIYTNKFICRQTKVQCLQEKNSAVTEEIAPFNSVTMKSLFVLAFLLCISVGYGLKCYQCISLKSWDGCDKTEVTCPASADRCGKALVTGEQGDVSVSVYAKGCSLSSTCNADKSELCKSSDPAVTVTECEINCCSGDLCNGAKEPMVSAIMLLACVLVAFLR